MTAAPNTLVAALFSSAEHVVERYRIRFSGLGGVRRPFRHISWPVVPGMAAGKTNRQDRHSRDATPCRVKPLDI